MDAKFKVRNGPPMAPLVIPLQSGVSLVIGRGSSADVLLEDAKLAEMHCQVVEQEGRYILFDLQTLNGTYVNGVRIARQDLQPGDVIDLGLTEMVFQRVEEGKTVRRERRRGARDPLPGSTVGDYDVLEPVGSGAISVVYRARQISRDRVVALKVLSARLARDPASRDRFLKGAKNASALRHSNIVQVYAAGNVGDLYYLTMEFVPGESVKEVMARVGVGGVLLPSKVHSVASQIADALVYAAQVRIVHRDIKPSNILIDAAGSAKLCDLELAKKIDEVEEGSDQRLGGYLGTVPYMPLEQVLDPETVDQRSDIYALGATMYGMLTGKKPFSGESRTEIVDRISAGEYKHPRELGLTVPETLWAVIEKAMKVYPEDRYQTADELRQALRHVGVSHGWEKP